MSDELTPITRKETFLAKAGGQNVVTPTPITREETFLQAIIDNGSGGGGGGGGVLVVHDNAGTLDKTWQEIADAGFAILKIGDTVGFTCDIHHSDAYYVTFATFLPTGTGFDDPLGYMTNSADDYPVMSD